MHGLGNLLQLQDFVNLLNVIALFSCPVIAWWEMGLVSNIVRCWVKSESHVRQASAFYLPYFVDSLYFPLLLHNRFVKRVCILINSLDKSFIHRRPAMRTYQSLSTRNTRKDGEGDHPDQTGQMPRLRRTAKQPQDIGSPVQDLDVPLAGACGSTSAKSADLRHRDLCFLH